eukprot:PITA_16290
MDRCCPTQSGSSQIDLSNELSYVSNGDRMPKLRPREIDVPIYPKRGPQFGVSSSRILQRLPRGDASASSSYSGNATPFKVQVNFEIPIFEGNIDVDSVDKWLNLLEGYFSVHEFSSREKIVFALLKAAPHVKDWWKTYYEQKDESTGSLFSAAPTWDSFRYAVKEQYYPVKSYEDKYIKWTTLRQGRDQDVPEFTNIFHTLHTQLGIKYSELHLVLKYCVCLHRYIQEVMEFLNISSLSTTYRYAVKIEQKFKQKKGDFGSANTKPKGKSQGGVTQDNPSKLQEKNNTTKPKKDIGKWCEFHNSPTHNTNECRTKQLLVAELKAFKSNTCSDPEPEPDKGNGKGKQIIDADPTATVATTKIQKNDSEDPEEGERLFHSQMWVKGSPLQFIVDSGSQKNLTSAEVVKRLGLPTTPHPHPYSIGWLHEG